MIMGLILIGVGTILFAAMLIWAIHTKDYSLPKENLRYYGCFFGLGFVCCGSLYIILQILEALSRLLFQLFGLA